ncbi:MAG: hypothetical protein ABJF04_21735 [Reichenbachiella sp.]|uniref:hypothetical protein n=1 Tax=Reichenbachiella sp. TaxID=2184521 RepID=UPI0032643768
MPKDSRERDQFRPGIFALVVLLVLGLVLVAVFFPGRTEPTIAISVGLFAIVLYGLMRMFGKM